MADLERECCVFGEADRFIQRFFELVALAAEMSGVDPSVRSGGPEQGEQFGLIGKTAGRVEQSGGESERALTHRRIEDPLHFRKCIGGKTAVFVAGNIGAERIVSAEKCRVDRRSAGGQRLGIRGEIGPIRRKIIGRIKRAQVFPDLVGQYGKGGESAVAGNFRGDALGDLAEGFRCGEQRRSSESA